MTVVDASELTAAQVVALLEADSLMIDAGLELLDGDDGFLEDITGDFVAEGSSVARSIFATLHGTARLNISREIVWGAQRLRPYLLASNDGETWYRWGLGVFLPSTPERQVGEGPPVWAVDAFDKLDILDTPAGGSVSIEAGANIVAAVTELIEGAGEAKVAIEPSSAVTASARVFSIAEDWTLLGIVNDLLDSAGFTAVYVDVDGWFRAETYRSPADRPVMWAYDADSSTTTVAEDRTSIADYYRAANVIVGIRDALGDEIPTEDNGFIYTLTNQSDGVTSIDQRAGRQVRRVLRGEYVDTDALIAAVTKAMDAEKRVTSYLSLTVSPTPVHGHFDVVSYSDSTLAINSKRYLVTDWELPLDGGNVSLSLRGV
jgi:hypothetical protein